MAKKPTISPQVYTFETDKSDYFSNQRGAKSLPVTSTSTGGAELPSNNNNNTNFIKLEDNNYLLQEDGSKLTIY